MESLGIYEGFDETNVEVFEQIQTCENVTKLIQLDDLEVDGFGIALDNMTMAERMLHSTDQNLYNNFPVLKSGSGLDRWHWLDTPQRDDNNCLATIPGMIGKYRMFDCDADLRVVCERRGDFPFPSPPVSVFEIPKSFKERRQTTTVPPPRRRRPQARTTFRPQVSDLRPPAPRPEAIPSLASRINSQIVPQVLTTLARPPAPRYPRVSQVGSGLLPRENPYLKQHDLATATKLRRFPEPWFSK